MTQKNPIAPGTGGATTPAGRAGGGVSVSGAADISAFLKTAAAVGPPKVPGERGRLVFALDATASREPAWGMAQEITGQMFTEAAKVGTLDIQLVFFRGMGECRSSGWVAEAARLKELMRKVSCIGGQTQIGRVLAHAAEEASARRVHAVVYIGDAMEESLDDLCGKAGRLAMAKVPVFTFLEGEIRWPSRPIGRSPASPGAPSPASIPARPRSSPSCSRRSRPSPPVAGWRWRMRQKARAARSSCSGRWARLVP